MAVLLCKACEQDYKPAAKILVLTVREQFNVSVQQLQFHCMQLDSHVPPLPAFAKLAITLFLCTVHLTVCPVSWHTVTSAPGFA